MGCESLVENPAKRHLRVARSDKELAGINERRERSQHAGVHAEVEQPIHKSACTIEHSSKPSPKLRNSFDGQQPTTPAELPRRTAKRELHGRRQSASARFCYPGAILRARFPPERGQRATL